MDPDECEVELSEALEALLTDSGGLADLLTQIVELRAAHRSVAHDLDPVDLGGVDREGPLNTHAEADLADGEGLAIGGAVPADHVALIDLDAFTIALGDAVVYLDVVADEEGRDVLPYLLLLESTNNVHGVNSCLNTLGSVLINTLGSILRAQLKSPVLDAKMNYSVDAANDKQNFC